MPSRLKRPDHPALTWRILLTSLRSLLPVIVANEITQHEVTEAFERVAIGPERKSKVMTESDKVTTAYHEAGHAPSRACTFMTVTLFTKSQ